MNTSDIIGLSPMIILSVTLVIGMLSIVVRRSHVFTLNLTLAGLLISFLSLRALARQAPFGISGFLTVDGYAIAFTGLILIAAFLTALLSFGYLKMNRGDPEEFYLLLLSATLGSIILASSSHLVSFFLGLELLSVSLYALIAYVLDRDRSLEASLKYLVLAASSSAFLLFGIALVYSQCGTMDFDRIAAVFPVAGEGGSVFIAAGFCMMMIGIGFKLGLVPFHLWVPDVYEGAPAPVTGFLATVSKGAVFAVLFRFFSGLRPGLTQPMMAVFACIAVASMFTGNLLALQQKNVKRLLAYSSIAHLGYLMVAFIAGGKASAEAVLFYFTAYFATTLAAFGLIGAATGNLTEPESIDDYRGLFWHRPWIASMLTMTFFSLAGIPLTAGFIAKYTVVASGVRAEVWLPVLALIVSSTSGLYYYLRVIVSMYSSEGPGSVCSQRIPVIGSVVMGSLMVAVVFLGIYPEPVVNLIHILLTVPFS